MRVLLAGGGTAGHINPALAIAGFIKQKKPDTEFLFVGNKGGMEETLVPQAGYNMKFIVISGFNRKLSPKGLVDNVKTVKRTITSSIDAKKIIKEFKPDICIGTGGYVSGPVIRAAAKLGVKTVDELVGRIDLIKRKKGITGQAAEVDLSNILDTNFVSEKVEYNKKSLYDFKLESTLDERILCKEFAKVLAKGTKKKVEVNVKNTDRSFGTIFGSEVTRKHYNNLDDDTFTVVCNGSGGQSFGAFIPKGLTLELVGDSNDYFGKGLSGGKLVVYPPKNSTFDAGNNIIIGNVALYGATSGKAFINGVAGERFCVRNSGATAVVEGVGDHGCEYMTGGRVVVIGKTGKNFAAGMSGGVAYVLDEERDLYTKLNKEMVHFSEVSEKYDIIELKTLIEEHVAATGSQRGKKILDNFDEYLPKFKKIIPHDYKRMMAAIAAYEEKGLTNEQAQIEAFYEIVNNK